MRWPASPSRAEAKPEKHLIQVLDKLVRFSIPSDFDAGHDVQKQILAKAEACGFNGQCLFAIRLALEEALINAIKHGNCCDPAKKVRVEANISPQQAEIIVEDEGCGFKRQAVPDPTEGENIEKCTGRGILLMEAYMNSVRFSRGGRRVRMIKKNEPDVLPRN